MAVARSKDDESREGWRPARLISVAGIRGQDEQEQRATSSLLAVMQAVPDFGRSLLAHAGAPKGRISTYTEISFDDAEGVRHRPDVGAKAPTPWRRGGGWTLGRLLRS